MRKTLEVITELKKEKLIQDYAIGGAIGVLKWVEPFFTRDLDIFVIPIHKAKTKELIDFSGIYNYLKAKGYNEWVGQWIVIEGVPVEFIPAEGLARESVENAIKIQFEGVKTKVINPEYLIALLLTAGRKKDVIKIEMLLKQTTIDMARLKDIVNRYGLGEKLKTFIEEVAKE